MKNIILRTVNGNEIINESNITLREGSILIQKVPDFISVETMQKFHNNIQESLNNNVNLITIPQGIELQILEVAE